MIFIFNLGMFLQKLSQQSLNVFPELNSSVADGGDGSEPGYESLPDHSNDPGYETVEHSKLNSKDSKKDGSDYDPNYETLRPTGMNLNTTDHYAKVLNKLDSNDGYSSIKPVKNKIISNDEDEQLGYCTISDPISDDRIPEPSTSSKNHDYASIRDTTKDPLQPEENVYSSISNDIDHDDGRNHGKTKSQSPISTPSPIPMSSNTALTMSMTSTISDTKTQTLTSPSSDGDSSSNTPIQYKGIRSTDQSQLTVSVSNYESLTGSESDSNYESVRYLNAQDRENPYEQLYNESDIKYDTLKRDDTTGSSLYAVSTKNADFSKNSSLSSSSGSGLGGRSSSSLNNPSSDTAG